MKTSENITSEVQDYYINFPVSTNISINSYTGISFKEIKYNTLSEKEQLFLEDKFFILSAFYGVLQGKDVNFSL